MGRTTVGGVEKKRRKRKTDPSDDTSGKVSKKKSRSSGKSSSKVSGKAVRTGTTATKPRAPRHKTPVVPWGSPTDLFAVPRPNPDGSVPPSIFSHSNTDRDFQGRTGSTTNAVSQVKYGPGEGMREGSGKSKTTSPGQARLLNYLTGSPKPTAKENVHEDRLTQYASKHSVYVEEAKRTGRPLTVQEDQAEKTGENATGASINHVIASGVGQNTLNAGIAQAVQGQQELAALPKQKRSPPTDAKHPLVSEYTIGKLSTAAPDAGVLKKIRPTGEAPTTTGASGQAVNTTVDAAGPVDAATPSADQLKLTSGLAKQAAAVGRQQMYSRAILEERRPVTAIPAGSAAATDPGTVAADPILAARNKALQDTSALMSGALTTPAARMDTYRSLLKTTFDSPGNLRVGEAKTNGRVSTGLDVELDSAGLPTPRSQRLFETHLAAKPDHDEKIFTTFAGSGDRMTSSRQVGPAAVSDPGTPSPSQKIRDLWKQDDEQREPDYDFDTRWPDLADFGSPGPTYPDFFTEAGMPEPGDSTWTDDLFPAPNTAPRSGDVDPDHRDFAADFDFGVDMLTDDMTVDPLQSDLATPAVFPWQSPSAFEVHSPFGDPFGDPFGQQGWDRRSEWDPDGDSDAEYESDDASAKRKRRGPAGSARKRGRWH